ncbi:DUF4145 domain-containing protein [Bacillus swezeyi]|uniref:DUF4145 domain-containing protein n=1 Tax=Bacillus swezeyi TaxID=1925020 RepID=UPI003F88B1F7
MILSNINWAEIANFISSILNSKFVTNVLTSWPLAVVIIVLALRKGLSSKLGKLFSLKFKDLLEVNFIQDEMEKAQESLDAVNVDEPSGDKVIKVAKKEPDSDKVSTFNIEYAELESIKNIAKESPDAAIIASWFEVERALNDFLFKIDESLLNTTVFAKVKHLSNNNLLNDNVVKSIQSLRKIRNNVAHFVESLSYGDAIDYYILCKDVIAQIDKAKKSQAS